MCGYLAIVNAATSIGLDPVLPLREEWKVSISSTMVQSLLDSQSPLIKARVHILDGLSLCYPLPSVSEALLGPALPHIACRESFSFVVNTASGERIDDSNTNSHWIAVTFLPTPGGWATEIRCSLGLRKAEVEMAAEVLLQSLIKLSSASPPFGENGSRTSSSSSDKLWQ